MQIYRDFIRTLVANDGLSVEHAGLRFSMLGYIIRTIGAEMVDEYESAKIDYEATSSLRKKPLQASMRTIFTLHTSLLFLQHRLLEAQDKRYPRQSVSFVRTLFSDAYEWRVLSMIATTDRIGEIKFRLPGISFEALSPRFIANAGGNPTSSSTMKGSIRSSD